MRVKDFCRKPPSPTPSTAQLRVVTLTKEGHNLLSRGKVVDSSQATYHGLKKPKEAFHDADLYRLYPEYMPVVTFTYIDPQPRKLNPYITHLRTYRPLFRRLPRFQFIYLSTSSSFHIEAAELFSFLIEGKGLSDLTRYFDFQTKWDRKQYGLLAESEVIFMSEARKRFTGPSIATLYYLWKRNRLPKDLQLEATPAATLEQKILFRAITVPGHKGIFGDSTKNWGDGREIRGWAPLHSPSGSPARPTQSLQRAADT